MNISKDFITPNKYSRPQTPLKSVSKVVVHYVGNPGSTAKNNRDYFNNLAATHTTYVSAHYVVGLQGEVIQCIPEEEIAYCSNSANAYSISVETCHPDGSGKFNAGTERTLVELVAAICTRYGLNPLEDVIRHYDVTGKACPLWYVSHPEDWEAFRRRVSAAMTGQCPEPPPKPCPGPEPLYRVQVGAFREKENALRMLDQLKSKGFDGFIVTV